MYVYWAPSSIGAALAAAGPDVAPAQRTPSSASAPNHRQRPGMLHFIFNGPPLTAARILEAQVAQVKRYYTPYPICGGGARVRQAMEWDVIWRAAVSRRACGGLLKAPHGRA